ncbi:hypothetical protein QE436_003822 [Pantoea anthophila]|nr:hypothetical protein [Pantoea anthophila]
MFDARTGFEQVSFAGSLGLMGFAARVESEQISFAE